MARIAFDKAARDAITRQLARRLKDEFDIALDPMDAVRLLDVLSETLGPHFYNQALQDAQAVLNDRVELIGEAIDGLARPAPR